MAPNWQEIKDKYSPNFATESDKKGLMKKDQIEKRQAEEIKSNFSEEDKSAVKKEEPKKEEKVDDWGAEERKKEEKVAECLKGCVKEVISEEPKTSGWNGPNKKEDASLSSVTKEERNQSKSDMSEIEQKPLPKVEEARPPADPTVPKKENASDKKDMSKEIKAIVQKEVAKIEVKVE